MDSALRTDPDPASAPELTKILLSTTKPELHLYTNVADLDTLPRD